MPPDPLLSVLLGPCPPPHAPTLTDWWTDYLPLRHALTRKIDQAAAGGFRATHPGFAFAAGIQAAGWALLPHLGPEERFALCVTETGGAHPRSLRARLTPDGDGWRLSGHKTFVTLGAFATTLGVVANTGNGPDGRPRLRVAMVPADRKGLRLEELPELPFVPEIGHTAVVLDEVRVEDHELLAGDGFERVVRPFRTVEDLHVHAALLGWLLRAARLEGWPHEVQERCLALIATLRGLAGGEPSSPGTHLALAGALGLVRVIVQGLEPLWETASPPLRALWMRDRSLLHVAERVRQRRTERAWERVLERGSEMG